MACAARSSERSSRPEFQFETLPSRHFYEIGKDAEICRGARNIELGSQSDRLARVRNFGLNEAVEPLLDRVRDFMQPRRPLANSELSPFSRKAIAAAALTASSTCSSLLQ